MKKLICLLVLVMMVSGCASYTRLLRLKNKGENVVAVTVKGTISEAKEIVREIAKELKLIERRDAERDDFMVVTHNYLKSNLKTLVSGGALLGKDMIGYTRLGFFFEYDEKNDVTSITISEEVSSPGKHKGHLFVDKIRLRGLMEEVVRKTEVHDFGIKEYIFYKKGEEIAKQKVDKFGNIVETTGKIPDGVVKEYYPSGKLKEEVYYKDCQPEGIYKMYYESEQVYIVQNFRAGKLDGIRKWYYENGQLRWEGNFKNNMPDGIHKSYYKDGQLKSEANYKDGKVDGISKTYYESGAIHFVRTYKNGKKITEREYGNDGNLVKREQSNQ